MEKDHFWPHVREKKVNGPKQKNLTIKYGIISILSYLIRYYYICCTQKWDKS